MRMTEEDIAAIVLREIEQAEGYQSDTLDSKRKAALDAYYGLTPEPVEGLPVMVSTDVADGVHAVLAQIMPVLQSTMVEFCPNSQEDEEQAQAESDFVRNQIEKAGGYTVVADAVHDALLVANGWLKVTVDTSLDVQEYNYPRELSDAEIAAVSDVQGAKEIRVTESASTVTVRATYEKRQLLIQSVPPENMLFSENGGQFKLDELRFIAERMLYTVTQLRDMGISKTKVEQIPDATDGDWSASDARQGIYQNDGELQSVQDAEKLKRIYCCFFRLSTDGKTSELRRIWIGGNTVLLNEPAQYHPYITGSAVPVPHRIQGTGLYELLNSVQNAKTHILRQYLANLNVMNASRVAAVEGQVNMSDLTTARVNGVVRVRNPNAIVPLPSNDIGPQSMAGLAYLDSVATQRIGSAVDFNEAQTQLMGTSATAAAGQLAKVEQMAGWFAGNLVRTMILPLFQMVHKVMRLELQQPVMARIGGKWQQTDPSQWQQRDATDVNLGLTTTERAQRTNALSAVISQQQQAMQQGGAGIITDLGRIYAAMSDWIRSNDLGDPTEYLINPNSPEAQQAQQQQAQQAQQQQQQMEQMQQQMIQMQHRFELQKQDNELKFKYYDANLDAELKEADMTSKAVIEVKKLNKPEKKKDADSDD